MSNQNGQGQDGQLPPKRGTEMKAYTKYSYFWEESCGLGPNGKRVLHGGVAAAGTYAAGKYGGVEIINENMPQALVIAAVAGTALTVAADLLMLDPHERALMQLATLRHAEASNPAMAAIRAANARAIANLRDGVEPRATPREAGGVIRR